MAIKELNVILISQLACAANDLAAVTNSDDATNSILARIIELAKDEVPEASAPGTRATISQEAISRAEANQNDAGKVRVKTTLEKWGDLGRLANTPGTTIQQLKEATEAVGYRGVVVAMA